MKKTHLMSVVFVFLAFQSCPGEAQAADSGGERIHFQFNPPVDVQYQATARSNITIDMGGAGRQASEGTVTSNIKITKTEGGYLFVTEPVSVVIKRNGNVVRDPLTQLIQESVVSIEADRNGKIISLSGYENLENKIREKFSEEEVRTLTTLIKVQELSSRAASEWESRLEGLVGKDFHPGDSWVDAREFQLPTGEKVAYYVRTKIENKQPCGERNCVKIAFRYSTQAIDLEIPEQTGPPKAAPSLVAPDQEKPGLQIRGFGARVLEPDTMMIHSENSQKIVEVVSTAASPGMPSMKIMEKNEYRCSLP
ncbi:MAG: hypothetical protein WC450_04860 [Candidatus Omnitrophota bacterium]